MTLSTLKKAWLIAILQAFIPFPSYACEAPLRFMAGPFFTQSMTEQYWSGFIARLTEITHCEIHLKTSNNFDDYIDDILSNKADILVAPSHYQKALTNNGFNPILATPRNLKGYLVSRLNIIKDPSLLVGKEIYTPSIYSRTYLELENWLEAHNLVGKVKLEHRYSHDSSMAYMLKNQDASAAIMGIIFDRLPQKIQNKYNTIEISNSGAGIILSKQNMNPAIVSAIITAANVITLAKFEAITGAEIYTAEEIKIENRFFEILQNKINNY